MFQFVRKTVKAADTQVLRFATARDWLFLVRASAFFGADVNNANTVTGNTPLHICKSQKMCELLLSKGANIHSVNSNNETALQKLSEKNINILWCAILTKNLDLMRFLLENGADANYPATETAGLFNKGQLPIVWAVLNYETDIARLLLEYGANINCIVTDNYYTNENLLTLARRTSNKNAAQLLLEKDIDVNFIERQEILCWAADENAIELAKISLQKGANVNHAQTEDPYRNFTPLWLAIRKNNLEIAQFFIQHNADINYINNQGKTMLMSEAVKSRGTSVVEFLIKNGAHVDLEQQAWQDTLANINDPDCAALIKNAQEVKAILPMLLSNKMQHSPLKMLPLDLKKELRTMLTGNKVTKAKPN